MAITVTTTVEQFTAVVGAQLQRQLLLSAKQAVNASASAVADEANRAIKRTLGPDQRLSGLGPRADVIRARVSFAKSTANPVAVIRPKGRGWWLIERPRAGGYDIKPSSKRKSRTEGHAPALSLGGNYKGAVKGGAYQGGPPAPITKTFRRAQAIVEANARQAVERRMRQGRYGYSGGSGG